MNRPSPLFGRRSLALAGASFALTSLAMLSAGGGAPAQAQALANHDSSAPVDMAADRIEVQDRADRVIVSGDVRVTQAGMTLTAQRSEEHTSELQSLMRISYAVFCVTKKNTKDLTD